MTNFKAGIFIRKPVDLKTIAEDIRHIKTMRANPIRMPHYIAAERHLSASEWAAFTNDLLNDYDWIAEFSAQNHPMIEGATPCIRVTGEGSTVAVIVDSEGYTYARYASIEGE